MAVRPWASRCTHVPQLAAAVTPGEPLSIIRPRIGKTQASLEGSEGDVLLLAGDAGLRSFMPGPRLTRWLGHVALTIPGVCSGPCALFLASGRAKGRGGRVTGTGLCSLPSRRQIWLSPCEGDVCALGGVLCHLEAVRWELRDFPPGQPPSVRAPWPPRQGIPQRPGPQGLPDGGFLPALPGPASPEAPRAPTSRPLLAASTAHAPCP